MERCVNCKSVYMEPVGVSDGEKNPKCYYSDWHLWHWNSLFVLKMCLNYLHLKQRKETNQFSKFQNIKFIKKEIEKFWVRNFQFIFAYKYDSFSRNNLHFVSAEVTRESGASGNRLIIHKGFPLQLMNELMCKSDELKYLLNFGKS